ncbi:MAG TPA: Ger(x)C family spore germination protein [Clostridiaceae bacterium]|nr:Ger(x)C family spore germination protein [Clostridiaceae bacterium]
MINIIKLSLRKLGLRNIKRKNKIMMLALILIMSFIFTSCYDAKELDEYTYVIAVGIDKGVTDKYRLTIKFHTMKGGGGGETGGTIGADFEILVIDAPTFFTGINMINSALARELNFMHAKMLVFSKEIAEEGVSTFIAPIIRFRQIRHSIHVVVSKESAYEFLEKYEPIEGNAISKALELIVSETSETGYIIHTRLHEFYTGLKSTFRQPMAILAGVNDMKNFVETGEELQNQYSTEKEYTAGEIPRKGGGNVEFYGTAVFNGDKMIGELTGEETRMLSIILGEFKRGNFSIQDLYYPDKYVPIDIRMERQPKVEAKMKGDKVIFDVKINLEGDILAIQSHLNYEEEPLKSSLEEAVVKKFKEEMNSLIEKCREWGVDIFRFGRVVCSNFRTIQEWENFNWLEKFKDSEVNINIIFNIRRTGILLKSSPIIDVEELKTQE